MKHDDFKTCRTRLRLSKVGIGNVLGYSDGHISKMEFGLTPIPRHVAWALVGIASQIQPDAVAEFAKLAESEGE